MEPVQNTEIMQRARRPEPSRNSCVFDPEHAYNLAATYYDAWKWQQIWRTVEWPYIDELVSKLDTDFGRLSVVDIGVGTGSYLYHLATDLHIAQCAGTDISPKMLEVARSKLLDRATLRIGNVVTLPFPDREFDLALLCRVASHVRDVDGAFLEIRRVLRSGGFLILSDLDPRHPYQFTRVPYGPTKIPVRTFKHSAKTLKRIAAQAGFRILSEHSISSSDACTSSTHDLPSSLGCHPPHPLSFVICFQKYFD